MFAWDSLTGALDELDAVRAQLREARGGGRTTRFYELLRTKRVALETDRGHMANVIELDNGWCLCHWVHDPYAISLYSSVRSLRAALCDDGVYLLSLTDTSKELGAPSVSRRDPGLTERQREILQKLAAGMSNREIATATSLAESTVKNSVTQILAALGVRDRTQAALIARDLDLLPVEQ